MGPRSNYKILSEKVNALKLTTHAKTDPDPELTDLSYDPNSTIKSIRQQQKHHFSEKEIAEIIRRYGMGETVYNLAEAFDCHRSTISAVLKRNGVKVTLVKSEKMFDPAEVVRLYQDGLKSKEIAKKYGVGEQTIRKCLAEQGVKMRTRWDYPKE